VPVVPHACFLITANNLYAEFYLPLRLAICMASLAQVCVEPRQTGTLLACSAIFTKHVHAQSSHGLTKLCLKRSFHLQYMQQCNILPIY